ncbi:MAG: hypothetical protein OQL20_09460 [Sedimenticola sp.]|nr:hypothetical protein [Sedimenticola sp.]
MMVREQICCHSVFFVDKYQVERQNIVINDDERDILTRSKVVENRLKGK